MPHAESSGSAADAGGLVESPAARADSPAAHGDPAATARRRVLWLSTGAFTVFFAVWVMFGVVGIPLRDQMDLSDQQFALLVAVPIFTGAVLRVPIGILADRLGGRNVMVALLLFCSVPTFLIAYADSYTTLLVLAFFLGLAGTSFAAGVAWVAAWYPRERQGLALGTFGAGNVGASITKLAAPFLVTAVGAGGLLGGVIPGGWRFVPFVFSIGLIATAVVLVILCPKNDPRPAQGRSLGSLLAPLAAMRVWRFGLYYVVVFGAYVALTLWLPKYYVDVYGLSLIWAGVLTSIFVFPASLLRPLGGWLSDVYGARLVTYVVFITLAVASFSLTFSLPVWFFTTLVVVVGVAMGIGKASVYKYVPEYFPNDVGGVGGLVGAIGAIGGFVLPIAFARSEAFVGRPEAMFYVMTLLAVASVIWLHLVVRSIRAHAAPGEI
jgi:MFS transporter, NNP family, nitrate/nitrite transporter